MKNFYAIIICLLITSTVYAQSLSLDAVDTISVTGYSNELEIKASGTLTNLTSDTLEVRWIRVVNDLESAWQTSVCDINLCWSNSTNTADFTLLPNGTAPVEVRFYPNNVVGNGTSRVSVFVINDSANTVLTGTYVADVSMPPNSIQNFSINEKEQKVTVYPNPVKDFINVKRLPSVNVKKVEVYNLLGLKMLSFDADANLLVNRFDISELPKGIYMVRVFDTFENVLLTKSFSKVK